MGAVVVYEPYILTFTPSNFSTGNVLLVNHAWGREVNVQIYINDEIVDADVTKIDDDNLSIEFLESGSSVTKSGKVIVS